MRVFDRGERMREERRIYNFCVKIDILQWLILAPVNAKFPQPPWHRQFTFNMAFLAREGKKTFGGGVYER